MNTSSKQRYDTAYSFVRKYDPQLFARVVNIANVVESIKQGLDEFEAATKIEKATMLLVYDLLNPNDDGFDF